MNLNAISARDIAVSALKAQRTRINLIANNIANAETTRTPEGGAFRRQLAVFRGEHLQTPGTLRAARSGVSIQEIVEDTAPMRRVYDPSHPDAAEDGYVEYPNIDLAVEMVDLVSAQRSYDASVAVVVSDKRMTQKALEIIQP